MHIYIKCDPDNNNARSVEKVGTENKQNLYIPEKKSDLANLENFIQHPN